MSIQEDADEWRGAGSLAMSDAQKGKPFIRVTIEDMQDFADGIAEENTLTLLELAFEKVSEWECRVSST